MKKFLLLTTGLFSLITFSRSPVYANHMNREGSCSGVSDSGQKISFKYFSDYQGCGNASHATIVFTEGAPVDGLEIGSRAAPKDDLDSYVFIDPTFGTAMALYQLDVKTVPGGISTFAYLEHDNKTGNPVQKQIEVKCAIQMYQYKPCN